MTIEEMKARKIELGYTNETVAELSGVPLGTVQKIFARQTRSPRYETVQKLTKFFSEYQKNRNIYEYSLDNNNSAVAETSLPGYDYRRWTAASATTQGGELRLKPPKKTIRIADGKCSIPPDELFFDDEISEMFEDLQETGMRVLLDTHYLIWSLYNSSRLTEELVNILEDENVWIEYSIVSLWECEIKHLKHPDKFVFTALDALYDAQNAGYHLIDVNLTRFLLWAA